MLHLLWFYRENMQTFPFPLVWPAPLLENHQYNMLQQHLVVILTFSKHCAIGKIESVIT